MADAVLLDLEALLAPIEGDSPVGEDLNHSALYDKINELRTTDDPGGAVNEDVGRLREGQARVADWPKVIAMCQEALATKTKDLTLVVYLAEALAREHGLAGVHEGINLLLGIHDRFWPDMYPQIVDDDLEPRAVWLERFDRLVQKTIGDFEMTIEVDGQTHPLWKWAQLQHMSEAASQAKGDAKDTATAAVTERRREMDNAVDKTPRSFYVDLLRNAKNCEESLGNLRDLVDEQFRDQPGVGNLEDPIPNFGDLRKGLEDCRYRIEDLLKTKPAPPPTLDESGETIEDDGSGTTSTVHSGGGPSGPPASRAEALRRLNEIAAFFQRTEPHSPVSYLVQRASRWGEGSLESWLSEVVGDDAVLAKLRETLGIKQEQQEPQY